MAIRRVVRAGKPSLFIDIRYRTSSGEKRRFRRDAQVQTMAAARAEERRLIVQLAEHGELPSLSFEKSPIEEVPAISFAEAIDRYKATVLLTKKPSTRIGYREILGSWFLAPLSDLKLGDIDAKVLNELDAKLVKQKASASRRRNVRSRMRRSLPPRMARSGARAGSAKPSNVRVRGSIYRRIDSTRFVIRS
jgi:hypothetical protein